MSFVEQHKAWLLPTLAAGVAGVVFMNIKVFKKPTAPLEPPAAPVLVPSPRVPQSPRGNELPGAPDLWKDLRALETPWGPLNHPETILARATRPLDDAAPSVLPRLHPERWKGLPGALALVGKVPMGTMPAAVAPHTLAFVGQTPSGAVVWMDGRLWHEGEALPGGQRVKRILMDRVLLEGPGGQEAQLLIPKPRPLVEVR